MKPWRSIHSKEKFHVRYDANIWTSHLPDSCSFDHHSVLVHLFEGRVFQVVLPSYGHTDHQRRHVVFPRFFSLAEST
jgi:hypothetical protein